MVITNFKINDAKTEIELSISDASSVNTLSLFTNKTYKDYSQVVDLSSKLTGSATENITITLGDLSIPYFDGLYFIQSEDSDEISQAITSDLTRYKECILDKVIELSICDDCLKRKSDSVINAQQLLIGLENSTEQGFIDESFILIKALDKYCSNDCKNCGEYKNLRYTAAKLGNTEDNEPSIPSDIRPFNLTFSGPFIAEGNELVVIQDDVEVGNGFTNTELEIGEVLINIDISKPFSVVHRFPSPIFGDPRLRIDNVSIYLDNILLTDSQYLSAERYSLEGYPTISYRISQ
jgi:hypothetical protein